MEISEQLHCLFSASVEERDESYVLEIPSRELDLGSVENGETYRVALLSVPDDSANEGSKSDPTPNADTERTDRNRADPPVEEGETRTVEIEDIGSQGDGITRVERGYVIIVPDTERSERVRIEIVDVQDNVAFADVVERLSYYD